MQIKIVRGRLLDTGLGTYRIPNPDKHNQVTTRRYDLLVIETPEGKVEAANVKVWPEVDRMIVPGNEGTFVFTKMWGATELHAVRIAGDEGVSRFIVDKRCNYTGSLILMLLLGIATSIFLIGIPLVLIVLYAMISLPRWRARLSEALGREGFGLRAPVRI